MLRISVIQVNGCPPASPLTHDFDERGGTIGRDDSNALMLPDPGRHISRMQAQVQYDGSSYVLVDHGGNPTQLNGRPLGKGTSATLRDGDEIGIADYTLRVELIRQAVSFGGGTQPNLAPASDPLGLGLDIPPAPGAASLPPASPSVGSHNDDPFAVFAPAASAPQPSKPAAAPPDDPFAAFTPRPTPQAAPRPANPLALGSLAQPAEANSLNALFGLDTCGPAHDPFASSPLGDPAGMAPPLAGGSADPLALLGGTPATAGASPVRDDSPLLRDAFTPPRLIDDGLPKADARIDTPAPPPTPVRPLSAPQGGVVSWATDSDPVPKTPPPAKAEARDATKRFIPPTAPTPRANVTIDPPGTAAGSPPSAAGADGDALLAAFARGIGLPGLAPRGGMTPELMEHVGRMLREAVQGTVELLVARAATKREVRADLTMIVSKNNNPLKFSPDVDFALMQLLLPQGSGFMKPDEAMRDAYDDLRAHQIGFMAGMRAALACVLARFTPAELEARLTTKSFLDSVLPANRKAKLWDLFEQRYSDISREAEDDFHSLFGREFLKAYEAQIEEIERNRG